MTNWKRNWEDKPSFIPKVDNGGLVLIALGLLVLGVICFGTNWDWVFGLRPHH